MTIRRCTAPSHDKAPKGLGELQLCDDHYADLLDALTGPSAAEDPTIDCVWGVRDGWRVSIQDSAAAAISTAVIAKALAEKNRTSHPISIEPAPHVVCGDGTEWKTPRDYRPARIAREYAALAQRLTGQTTGEQLPYAAPAATAPLPIDAAVAELRVDLRHTLLSWARTHVKDFRLSAYIPPEADVAHLTRFLAIHRDQAAAKDWAGLYVDELNALRRRARRLIDLPQPRRIAIAACPEDLDGARCTGTLHSVPREDRDRRPVKVTCDTCGTVYTGERWRRLSDRLIAAAAKAS